MTESEFSQILRERVILPASFLDLQRAEIATAILLHFQQCKSNCSSPNCSEACEQAAASCIDQVGVQYAVPVSRFNSCLEACKAREEGMECVTRCAKSFSAHCQSCRQVVERIAQNCKRSS